MLRTLARGTRLQLDAARRSVMTVVTQQVTRHAFVEIFIAMTIKDALNQNHPQPRRRDGRRTPCRHCHVPTAKRSPRILDKHTLLHESAHKPESSQTQI